MHYIFNFLFVGFFLCLGLYPLPYIFLLGKLEVKATVKKLFEVCRKFEQESDWDKYIKAVE